ncbi:hypothetical protein CWI36_0269p0020 [Hamiltosporidium magnivora]|uniref:Uncharacterized protein n=1 Tax=Hamiltosporidium magnivora TaxID=148818 RepID=A0A4Q9LK63_9MICR|nr:hypothetical protein CWI36_0269p0020 [Hamiltosporidium magnivora]
MLFLLILENTKCSYLTGFLENITKNYQGIIKNLQFILLITMALFLMLIGIRFMTISLAILLVLLGVCTCYDILKKAEFAYNNGKNFLFMSPSTYKDYVIYALENPHIVHLIIIVFSLVLASIILAVFRGIFALLYGILLIFIYKEGFHITAFAELGIQNEVLRGIIFVAIAVFGFFIIAVKLNEVLFALIFSFMGSVLLLITLEAFLKQKWGYESAFRDLKKKVLPEIRSDSLLILSIMIAVSFGIQLSSIIFSL